MLYPYETPTREQFSLNGLWYFRADFEGVARTENWQNEPIGDARVLRGDAQMMAVPASFNDLTQEARLRDFVGEVWYERQFHVPAGWSDKQIVLRFGSVTHHGEVFLDGQALGKHKGGYLPFEIDLSEHCQAGGTYRLTVCVSNVLDYTTLPPGEKKTIKLPGTEKEIHYLDYFHDFFNYAGIHRNVTLIARPKANIEDITVRTDFEGSVGKIDCEIEAAPGDLRLTLRDVDGQVVASGEGKQCQLEVADVKLWNTETPYLYQLEVELFVEGTRSDSYALPVGVRTVEVRGKQFLLNGEPFYFKGFGMHEDMDIKGKGHDQAMLLKNFALLKWIGANSFRTSHYPYDEEFCQLADRLGILVIDETPAVGLIPWESYDTPEEKDSIFHEERYGKAMQEHHLQVIRELIARDKNHPSVVMWSVANEAKTCDFNADWYFKPLFEEVRKLDKTRPVTLVEFRIEPPTLAKVNQYVDMICLNAYVGWYVHHGFLESVEDTFYDDLRQWWEAFDKPIMISEFGADTLAGFHSDPPLAFSEEFQCEMIAGMQAAMDRHDYVIGEHLWNFADFATKQGLSRVGGNKKGIFTRQRQPKMIAHQLRTRWEGLEPKT